MPRFVIPNDDIQLVFTAMSYAKYVIRLRMPSSNDVETMSVQHYSEKEMWQLATKLAMIQCRNRDKFGPRLLPKQHNTREVWEWQCHYKDQVGNDAASRPTR